LRGPCSTPSNEWQLGARADEEPDRLRAGRFEVMHGKGHVVDPENIRPPAGLSMLLKIGVVAHASSSRWPR
jgi:hypothetical protein